jgi:hypothetical protein
VSDTVLRLKFIERPKRNYVYVHLKADSLEPFYVGEGQKRRGWHTHGRSKHWNSVVRKHGVLVMIAQDDMLEAFAFELERNLIARIGRKDKGLGPLVNYTDGGDGASGAIRSDEFKARNVAFHTGRKRSEETCKNIRESLKGKAPPSEEARLRMSKAQTGRTHAEATKQKMSASGRKRDPSTFGHRPKVAVVQSESVIFEGTSVAEQWCKENTNPLADKSNIVKCCRGKINSAYGHTWRYATPEETAALKEKGASCAPLSDLLV